MSRDSSQPLTNPAAATIASGREVSYEMSRSASVSSSITTSQDKAQGRASGQLRAALRDAQERLEAPFVALRHQSFLGVVAGRLDLPLGLLKTLAQARSDQIPRLVRLLEQ